MISIIIPIFNSEKFLLKCLLSIQKQTFTDFECICIDDGSTDNSLKLLKDFSSKDNRFIVVHQENSGVSKARNYGLKIAKGDFITFIDSDDSVEPKLLEVLFTNIKNNNVDLSVCSINYEKENRKTPKKVIFETSLYDSKSAYKLLFSEEGFQGFPFAKLYKKEILQENNLFFNEELKYLEDFYFNYKYISYCKNVYFEKSFLYNYFFNSESATKSPVFNESKFTAIKALKLLYKSEKSLKLRFHIKANLATQCLIFLDRYDFSNAKEYEKKLITEFHKNFFYFITDSWISLGRKKMWIASRHKIIYKLKEYFR